MKNCELYEMGYDGRIPCQNAGILRSCGHYACDAHTDDESNECLFCVAVPSELGDDDAFLQREAEMGVD